MRTLTLSDAQSRRLAEALRGYDLGAAVARVMRMIGEDSEVRRTGRISDAALDPGIERYKREEVNGAMKRAPRAGEPALTHTRTDTGDRQVFALAPENYDPRILATLDRSLPSLPGPLGWSIVLDRPAREYQRFAVVAGQKPVSRNRVKAVVKWVELTTSLLPGAARLAADELHMLADLEQCVAIVLLRHSTHASRNAGSGN
jgi:hypothetical protein